MWRHIQWWQGPFLFRAHEVEKACHNLTVVGLKVLKLRQEVVGHPCMLLTLVLVAKWDCVSRRDKLLTGKDRCILHYEQKEKAHRLKAHLPNLGYPTLQGELSHSHLAGRVEVFVCPEPETP